MLYCQAFVLGIVRKYAVQMVLDLVYEKKIAFDLIIKLIKTLLNSRRFLSFSFYRTLLLLSNE